MILFKQGPFLINEEKIEYIEGVSRFNEIGIVIKTLTLEFHIDTKIKSSETTIKDILNFVYAQINNKGVVDFNDFKGGGDE